MEKYKWKWAVFGVLGCMDNADFGEKNEKKVMCSLFVTNYYTYKLSKNTVLVHLQSNPAKSPQSAPDDVEGV